MFISWWISTKQNLMQLGTGIEYLFPTFCLNISLLSSAHEHQQWISKWDGKQVCSLDNAGGDERWKEIFWLCWCPRSTGKMDTGDLYGSWTMFPRTWTIRGYNSSKWNHFKAWPTCFPCPPCYIWQWSTAWCKNPMLWWWTHSSSICWCERP